MRIAMLIAAAVMAAAPALAETPANQFVEVATDDVGGHYFSQVIYAPTAKAVVTWGTRTHGRKIRAHETQHFSVADNTWIDAWPFAPGTDPADGKQVDWAGQFKSWGDWAICDPTSLFYERDGVRMPRPNSSFHQVCWDAHNKRMLFYVGSMTFSYEPVARQWKQIYDHTVKAQPPALLLWGSLCYDHVNKQVILFGGGGVDAPDGRPHTWALDVTNDTWKKLDLAVEPPARCNSRMVYDGKRKQIVLFGGDDQQAGLSDTWVFDVTKQQWQQKKPNQAPWPRYAHAMAYLDKSGVVLMVGGTAVAEWSKARALSRQAWVYGPGEDTWTPLDVEVPATGWLSMDTIAGTDEVVLASAGNGHARTTWRFRYDPAAAKVSETIKGVAPGTKGYKMSRTPESMKEGPAPDAAAHAKVLAELPVNQWVKMTPPTTVNGRTWGTSLMDTDRNQVLKWGGGHSGYQGTDMAFYDVATDRFEVDMRPAETPAPFGKWARRPAGRSFYNTPWARHMRHTCAYDAVRKVGVFTDAGGSDWFDRDAGKVIKWTWFYDPAKRAWLERLVPQPFPGGGSVSPIAVPTPDGVVVYQHEPGNLYANSGRLWRLTGEAGKPETFGWEEIEVENKDRPYQREHMTIVYDSKRGRLVFLSHDSKTGVPELWFFSMKDRTWVKNPEPAAGGISTREAVYIPAQDAILAYGPAEKKDPVKTRVYLCGENRWVPLEVETPYGVAVHEVGLEYDAAHDVAVLMWPTRFEGDIVPHMFRLDASKLTK